MKERIIKWCFFTLSSFFIIVLTSTPSSAIPFRFEWTAEVTEIIDAFYNPASLSGVNVGDSLIATVIYDPEDFANGVAVTSDGLDYDAPSGLELTYSFSSGGVFTEGITKVRVRDGGAFDQFNWKGGMGGLLFQINDFSDSSFDLPLPSSFNDMHDLFLASIGNFDPADGNHFYYSAGSFSDDRIVRLDNQAFSFTAVAAPVPEPATFLLLGSGLVGFVVRRKRKQS